MAKLPRAWAPWEREWAAMMWARGLSTGLIAKMLRRLPGSVEQRLKRDGRLVSRPTVRIRKPICIHSQGYRIVLAPGHPNADQYGRIYEHRLVASASLGRPLADGESVHHKNGDRTDNRPENLEVFASHADHMAVHREERTKWKPWQDEALVKGREMEYSAREIGKVVGMTTTAVYNRVRRLKLSAIRPGRRRTTTRQAVDLTAHAQHLATVYAGLPKEET